MSLDGKILARARRAVAERRENNEKEFAKRRSEAYLVSPRLREIDEELKLTVIEAISAAMDKGGDPVKAVREIQRENAALRKEKESILIGMGLPGDWLTFRYVCPKCSDTGYDGVNFCSCLMDIYREEQRKELSVLLKLGEETFDTFRLDYYSRTPLPGTRESPYDHMRIVYEACKDYACNFSDNSKNLFLSGGSGLGKTFLSTSIAKTVSERGFSVVYDTAPSIFAKYEQSKFSRSREEGNAADAEIARLEKCDLLIVDDLGTELATAFVTTALYSLMSARLTAGKKLVINSNLSRETIGSRYSPAIMSRLDGEFVMLQFIGEDIRKLKNKR